MLPLVWDKGAMDDTTEGASIMVMASALRFLRIGTGRLFAMVATGILDSLCGLLFAEALFFEAALPGERTPILFGDGSCQLTLLMPLSTSEKLRFMLRSCAR